MRPRLQGEWLLLRGCVRKATPRAWAIHFEGLPAEIWVPKRVGEVRRPNPARSALWPDHVRVKRWWAGKQERMVHLLTKHLAGPPPRAPGDFRVRPRRAQPHSLVGVDLATLPAAPEDEFHEARSTADLSLEEAGALLGLPLTSIAELERGAVDFIAPDGWTRAVTAVDAEARRRALLAPRVLQRLAGIDRRNASN